MIPITQKNYELLDLKFTPKNTSELKWQNLLKTQLLWPNKNIKNVKGKAFNLYNKYKNNTLDERIKKRCCNFILLEKNAVNIIKSIKLIQNVKIHFDFFIIKRKFKIFLNFLYK